GNFCTRSGCDGQGNCDQNHVTKTCPPADECNGVCDTTTGKCTPKTSTPCTDSDGNTCTTAGCEISPTNAELGVCVQTHMFASNSTPCADTDGNTCTTAGCEIDPTNADRGVCVQTHMFASNSTPCADTDGNNCTTAGCNGQGVCDQNHLFAANSTPCPESDGNLCTTAGCNGQGVCDQKHLTKTCPAADECNGVCDTTTGKCTPKTSTPCTDSDGNTCTTAGCAIDPTN